MTTPLYPSTIGAYIRQAEALAAIMAKGREHLGDTVDAFVNQSLCEDMLPFSFQIRSIHHSSVNAIEALRTGLAGTPPAMEITSYGQLEALLSEVIDMLKALTPEELDTLLSNDVTFVIGETKLPFTGLGFLTSFSLPNYYFHVTTAYNLLRIAGVPIGKRDYLGAMDMKLG